MCQGSSGRANWATYEAAAKPILERYIKRLGRLPDGEELTRDGHGWIVFSAKDHHGSFHPSLRRMGFEPTRYLRTGFRPPKVYVRTWWAYWPRQRRQAIFTTWPEWTAAGIMPPSDIVGPKFPGLRKYWYNVGSWEDAAHELGLRTILEIRREQHRCQSVVEALRLFGYHGRWPKARECRPWLKSWRFKHRTSWAKTFGQLTVHPSQMDEFREACLPLLRLIRNKHQKKCAEPLRIVNGIIIRSLRSHPFSRPSS